MLRDSGHPSTADEVIARVPDASEGQLVHADKVIRALPSLADIPHSGQVADADEAGNALPDASEGRHWSAVQASLRTPSLAEIIDSGHPYFADMAKVEMPDASEGFRPSADMAGGALPSLATVPNSGQKRFADEANSGVPETSEGHASCADKALQQIPSLVIKLAELQVRRLFYIKAKNRQVLAAKALVRRALGATTTKGEKDDKLNLRASRIVDAALANKPPKDEDAFVVSELAIDLLVVADTIKPLTAQRKIIEGDMKKLAKVLPVYPWAKSIHGLGELGLAVIVAEAGDLSRYPKKGHLWKRLGLAVHDGKAYSTWRTSKPSLTAEQWTEAGYSPRRRAEMHAVIAEPLFRAQSVAKSPYRAIYDRRRAATAIAHADWTPMHSHMDALRVMTKYLIRDLWQAWRSEQGVIK